jgi:hypothetical protein
MAEKRQHLFISYAPEDAEVVTRFVGILQTVLTNLDVPVDIWMDRFALKPGEQWEQQIRTALLDSVGMLVFVSPGSSIPDWARDQIDISVRDKPAFRRTQRRSQGSVTDIRR